MKKENNDAFERFCSFDALYDASYKVCRNVRWKDSTINFEETRIEMLRSSSKSLKLYSISFGVILSPVVISNLSGTAIGENSAVRATR